MFNNLGLQLYTCRNYMTDEEFAKLTLKKIRSAGYTELHTAGRYGFTPEKFLELVNEADLKIIGTHYDWDLIQNDPETTIKVHNLYGTKNIGIGGMPRSARTDLKSLNDFIEQFNKVADLYSKEGFKLNYHNHNFEFMKIDGNKTIMDLLAENLNENISFVLDTCWVVAGCADLEEWMNKLEGRIDILHLKDVMLTTNNNYFFGTMTEIGNGFIPWNKIINLAEKINVKHYIVEQDGNFIHDNPFESIKKSSDYLKQFMK